MLNSYFILFYTLFDLKKLFKLSLDFVSLLFKLFIKF